MLIYATFSQFRTETIYIHKEDFMRTTLIIDDVTMRKTAELTGVKEKTSLVRMWLEALISRECSKRLAQLGGSYPSSTVYRCSNLKYQYLTEMARA